MVKFIFITGGVMSGIGKGIVTASIAKILQVRGFSITAVKIDPYLNVDAGTMNPIMHGEVFVTDDGGELDMDLGTYERFLNVNLSKKHNITTGQVYSEVINMERKGEYLGKCVQIIPHITDEIKKRIKLIADETGVEVVVTEIGGTVGDIEGLPFLEAARQIKLEEGVRNVLYAHLTWVPILSVVGEQKTKPTQHSVQELRRIGIQTDMLITRSEENLKEIPKKKIALFCNVEERSVFTSPNMECIYQSPSYLNEQGMGDYICEKLNLPLRKAEWKRWESLVYRYLQPSDIVRIAMCGKYSELADSYVSINEALQHAGAICNAKVDIKWIETELFETDPHTVDSLSKFDGILVPGGFGSRGTEGKIAAIRYAREHDQPYLGICFGFQLAVVEYARYLGFENANSTEVNPNTPYPVIDLMPEQRGIKKLGASMRLGSHEILVSENTLAYKLYHSTKIQERHRHRYEVNPKYLEDIIRGGLHFSAKSVDGIRMEILELSDQYFFMATQFHGEFKSRPENPSPPYYGFIKSCLDKQKNLEKPVFEDVSHVAAHL